LRLSSLHIHLNAVFNVYIFIETARAHRKKRKGSEKRKRYER